MTKTQLLDKISQQQHLLNEQDQAICGLRVRNGELAVALINADPNNKLLGNKTVMPTTTQYVHDCMEALTNFMIIPSDQDSEQEYSELETAWNKYYHRHQIMLDRKQAGRLTAKTRWANRNTQ